MERVGAGVDAEAASCAVGGTVQGTGAALLAVVIGACAEAEQRQHLGDRDGRPHGREVDGRTRRVRIRFDLLVPRLPHLLAAFTRLGKLAIPFGMDGHVFSEEPVVGRDIADGAVQADVVVQLSDTKPTIPISVISLIRGTRGSISGCSFMNP